MIESIKKILEEVIEENREEIKEYLSWLIPISFFIAVIWLLSIV